MANIMSLKQSKSYKAVTYNYKGKILLKTRSSRTSRLGDYILLVSSALWYSHTQNLPLLVRKNYNKHFPHQDLAALEDFPAKFFDKIVRLNSLDMAIKNRTKKTLYVVQWKSRATRSLLFQFAYHDKLFYSKLRTIFKPSASLPPLKKTRKEITVALHIRKADQHDLKLYGPVASDEPIIIPGKKYVDMKWPSKFPPNVFYINTLEKLYKLIKTNPIRVILFTNDLNPDKLLQKIKSAVKIPNMIFQLSPGKTVLEDWNLMQKCDGLIRGSSLFAWSAELLGLHKFSIHPKEISWLNNNLIVGEVITEIRHQGTFFTSTLDKVTPKNIQQLFENY